MAYPAVDSRSAETAYSTKRNIVVQKGSVQDIIGETATRNRAAQYDELADPTADSGYVVGTAGTSPTSVPPNTTRSTNVLTTTHNVPFQEV